MRHRIGRLGPGTIVLGVAALLVGPTASSNATALRAQPWTAKPDGMMDCSMHPEGLPVDRCRDVREAAA
jgi:hypothetical protein